MTKAELRAYTLARDPQMRWRPWVAMLAVLAICGPVAVAAEPEQPPDAQPEDHRSATAGQGEPSSPAPDANDSSSIRDRFAAFLVSPDRASYLAVRQALVASQFYDPYSDEMDDVKEMLDAGEFEKAREKILASMPNLMLSPGAHLKLSFIAEKTNDEEGDHMESFIATTCVEGILATGDGTTTHPYQVLRTSDEYDVISYLQKRSKGQSLIHEGERHYDVIRTEEGEIWFDITDAYDKLSERFGAD